MVMATGIVSLACHFIGYEHVSRLLFWINIAAYLILWTLNGLRATLYTRRFFGDLIDHGQGVSFFTWVAATCVLGNQFLLIAGMRGVATALWVLGIILWFVLTYTIFTCIFTLPEKPPIIEALHGGWLVSVVATQSVSLLGSMLASGFEIYRESTLFFALTMWLGGGMLYIWIISMIFYRYAFLPMKPSDLSPPYWINMGAMAISTLAGVSLVAAADGRHLLDELQPFLKGFTLLFWATATAWIPMLITLGVWRHVLKRYPITYDLQYWALVFPLGMYTTCTYRLEEQLDLPYLQFIPNIFVWLALIVWCLTFAGMLRSGVTLSSRTTD
ncbi:putative membrane protein [Allorhodopirellula solitaria]|uniref:Putative membrane protein n=2 Tax=Allorhodopirellula solitaria TaxID=2527987 RepID=A0A5C5WMD8_9BACT|nr:putative membrane protein [Allorhodopirellula solitaria]